MSTKFYMILLEKVNICTYAWMLYQLAALNTFLNYQSLIPLDYFAKMTKTLHFDKKCDDLV